MIIDGKIKVHSGASVERFTSKGLKLTDGAELDADVILYATGCAHSSSPIFYTFPHINMRMCFLCRFDDARGPIRDIIGEEEGAKVTPIWGLNAEGELRSAWREIGIPNLWYMMGNFAWCRFFSKHLALRECHFLSSSFFHLWSLINIVRCRN